jgi:sugar lactone lactonase YvrE
LLRFALAVAVLAGLGLSEARADFHNLLVTNLNGGNVTQYDPATGAPASPLVFASAPLVNPRGIVIGPDNNVYVNDISNSTVQKFNGTTGASLGTFVSAGSGGLSFPHGMSFGPNGDLFVSSFLTNNVLEYNGTTGAFVKIFATDSGLVGPTGLTFGPNGDLFVASSAASSNQVLEFNGTTGAFVKVFATGNGLSGPAGLTFASDGSLFVANFTANTVLRFSPAGALLATITDSGLNGPSSIVFNAPGSMLVSNNNTTGTNANSILQFNANLVTNTFSFNKVFATAGLSGPIYMALLAPVPEPSAVVLFGLGLAGVAAATLRKARRDRGL